jgi:cardiolipin synthase
MTEATNSAAKRTGTAPSGSRVFALPNLLTYSRIAAVPLVAACLFAGTIYGVGFWLRWVALFMFVAAALTDLVDGWAARTYGEQSSLGRILDPIADKLLVGATLLFLAFDDTIRGWSMWAAFIILCREILVSGMREYLAELRVSVPVSRMAKWKTVLQNVAVGFLVAGPAGDLVLPGATWTGISLLWIAAVLTLYTGFDYFRAGLRHFVDKR